MMNRWVSCLKWGRTDKHFCEKMNFYTIKLAKKALFHDKVAQKCRKEGKGIAKLRIS